MDKCICYVCKKTFDNKPYNNIKKRHICDDCLREVRKGASRRRVRGYFEEREL